MMDIEYKYRTIAEITQSIHLYTQFSIIEIIILAILAIWFAGAVLYFLPALKEIKRLKVSEYEKKRKKLALKQIVIQKEVEEEIENELKQEAK